MTTLSERPKQVRMDTTSHCIPEEPPTTASDSPRSSVPSLCFSDGSWEPEIDILPSPTRTRRASTVLISKNVDDMKRIIGDSGTTLIENCCGGGCCMNVSTSTLMNATTFEDVPFPGNRAFRSLQLKLGKLPTVLSGVVDLPAKTIELLPVRKATMVPSPPDSGIDLGMDNVDFTPHQQVIGGEHKIVDTKVHPPNFVQPHVPYNVFSAKIFSTRELTKPGAEKRTYHFDLDVTDYPDETGVDFKVGGAIGVLAPNDPSAVDELMDLLAIPKYIRDRNVLLKTSSGRYPTVWGEDKPRELLTTRRALLTWCTDFQSYPPTKPLLRLLAEHASSISEKKILTYLVSAEGQGVFCDIRTGPHLTIPQILHAFPSSKPPLDHLLSVLTQLMPRFYSLSHDPIENCPGEREKGCTRLIEIAVTVHETCSWAAPGATRTGLGSGFFERQATKFLEAEAKGEIVDLRIPMFKGLMANPLAREFVADGPMLLVGAGVGVAPFRGFVQRRLKNANCANKVWVLQGIRDSLVDELYAGEWGVHEDEVKKVVQSRKGESRYVQEEVIREADLVWWIINQLEGRVYVCGSSKGMGEGVERALRDVAMSKGNMSDEEAGEFWKVKTESGQYIAETW